MKALIFIFICILVGIVGFFFVSQLTSFHITFFSVGQGDSALVQCGRTQMLIDGGPDRTVLSKLGRALPIFDRTIEYVVLTHSHSDHVNGIISVYDRYNVSTTIISKEKRNTSEMNVFYERSRNESSVHVVAEGDTILFGDCGFFEVLAPEKERTDFDNPNDASVVLLLKDFKLKQKAIAVFTGDATKESEEHILSLGAQLSSDILKVSHHGSKTSTIEPFLGAVSPRFAVISVGKNNYGHPSHSVLKRLEQVGTKILRTDKNGDIHFFIKDGEVVLR